MRLERGRTDADSPARTLPKVARQAGGGRGEEDGKELGVGGRRRKAEGGEVVATMEGKVAEKMEGVGAGEARRRGDREAWAGGGGMRGEEGM